jgi:hypothetical protein
MSDQSDATDRIGQLERQLRQMRRTVSLLVCLMVAATLTAWQLPTPQREIIRARGLIIEDEQGRDRIILGAPIPDPREGRRSSPSVGMVINDTAGYERFGLALRATGAMGMGFDAPPGTGDPRNRERINIVADPRGGAYIRMLDRRTFVRSRLILDDSNRVALEFLDFPAGQVLSRRISMGGDSVSQRSRE